MEDRTVLVAQITDCHIVERGELLYGKVDTAATLTATVAHINTMMPRPDLVVMTGDLVNDGRDEQYEHAAAILAVLEVPLVLVPGNHDDRTLMRAYFPQVPAGGPDDRIDFVLDDLPLRVIGLDSTVPRKPYGRTAPEQASWLNHALAGGSDRPTLIFQHHPPFITGIQWMDAMAYRDPGLLADVVGRHPHVLAVACGHMHRVISTRFANTVAMTTTSTGAQLALALDGTPYGYSEEPPTVALHRWSSNGGLVTHTSVVSTDRPWLPDWAPRA